MLRSGTYWKDLPPQYPSPSTCWRRLRDWEEQGVWLAAWRALRGQMDEKQQLKWAEVFADGGPLFFCEGKIAVGETKGGKGTKDNILIDAHP